MSRFSPKLTFFLALLFPAVALAQVGTTTTSTIADPVALLLQGNQVIDAWKSTGILSAIVIMVNILVNLTKLGPINAWITQKDASGHDKLWIRPVLALVLSALTGAVNAASTGGGVLLGIVQGMFAGAGAIALHEIYSSITKQPGTIK